MSVYFYEPNYLFDRFFENALGLPQRQIQGDNTNTAPTVLRPRMDLHEDAEKNIVTALFELPGLKKEDVNIDVRDGRLTVTGESKISSEHQEEGYAVKERKFGKFSRTLRLPQGVKEEQINASLENGVLTVTFPKAAPESAPRKITIS
ncbi:small heat shock protein, partial [Mucidula mucida]